MPRDISWTTERTQRIDVWPKFYLACCQARRWSICLYITYIIYGPPKTIGIVQYTIIKFLYLKRNYSSISLSLSRLYINKICTFQKIPTWQTWQQQQQHHVFWTFLWLPLARRAEIVCKKKSWNAINFYKVTLRRPSQSIPVSNFMP